MTEGIKDVFCFGCGKKFKRDELAIAINKIEDAQNIYFYDGYICFDCGSLADFKNYDKGSFIKNLREIVQFKKHMEDFLSE